MSNESVVLITGAARRIGKAIVQFLHSHHFNVIIHYQHSADEAEALRDACLAIRPNSASLLRADLSDVAAIKQMIDSISKTHGRLDLLINNASQFFPTKIDDTTETAWHALMSSNLMAPYFLSTAAFPLLKLNHGALINMSDVNAMRPKKDYSVYCTAKAGLNFLTQALAREFAPTVRCNAIAIGSTLWPEGENTLTDSQKQELISKTLLNRCVRIEDVVNTVLFLAENQSLTGQVIVVDSGRSVVI